MPDDDIRHFPKKYGENYLYLLEVDPTHIHAFWEIIQDNIPDQILKKYLNNPDLCLKIHCNFRKSQSFCIDLHVQGLINDWFVKLERPFTKCHAELGYNDPGKEKFISLCRSNEIGIFLEHESSINSIKKINQNKTASHPYQKRGDDINPFLGDREKGKSPHPMEYITEKDIKDYYRLLSEKHFSNPGFSPWRSILERIYSAEALRTLRPSGPINLNMQDSSLSETNSSYWSAISSYSSFFKIDQDK